MRRGEKQINTRDGIRIHIDEGALLNAEYGPQQVESLLRFVVEPSAQKSMRDAEDDADAIEHLMARKGKKKRKKKKY